MAQDSKSFQTALRPPFILPYQVRVAPTSSVHLVAGGGQSPYTWSVDEDSSGGATVDTSGNWTAGPLFGTDTIRATDSAGNFAQIQCIVADGPTLLDLRTQSRERADTINDPNITDSELNSYINASMFELYDMLVKAYDGQQTNALPYDITCDGNSDTYPYPPGLYKLRGVDIRLCNMPQGFWTVRRMPFRERNAWIIPGMQLTTGFMGWRSYRYTDVGQGFRIFPRPANGTILRVWYVPKISKLVNDTDVVDGVSGWEDYIIVDAAIKMMVKQESDASALVVQKAGLAGRISEMSQNKDIGSPQVVADTMLDDYGDGYGSPGNGPMGW